MLSPVSDKVRTELFSIQTVSPFKFKGSSTDSWEVFQGQVLTAYILHGISTDLIKEI
jgi:hypothetical protein